VISGLGMDPRKLAALRMAPRFLAERSQFLKACGRIDRLTPILSDYADQAGTARGHYFHQDLLVATLINQAAPRRHIDIGSRIDGFVAHVAAFRAIEVIDIRPLAIDHERITFLQMDLLRPTEPVEAMADSISCLHALEHFGLGRYGDAIDPRGHLKAFETLCAMLEPRGVLYISVPIGRAEVCFNAHRVFGARDILGWGQDRLVLERFDYVDDAGALHVEADVSRVPDLDYGCGIYTLRKPAA
jgi:hypothetical protein